jgi:hypothetical protein
MPIERGQLFFDVAPVAPLTVSTQASPGILGADPEVEENLSGSSDDSAVPGAPSFISVE